MDDEALTAAASRVREMLAGGRRRMLFITGAGLSAESGLPTYRGVGGLYADSDTEHGMPIEVALSGTVFRTRPEITWKHIAQLEAAVRGARPNRAHSIIAELEREHDVVVLTQNVDGFHRAAGSTQVIDIHGDCHVLHCTACSYREEREDYAGLALPPRCPKCGGVVRPEVVLFDEMLPSHKVSSLRRELLRGFDAYFSIGTTSVFPYIAEPILHAARLGRLTVEINPEPTEVTPAIDVRFACGAVRALGAVFG
ncbi:MAG TPA: NAD-dependent protein deacylase [Polyangiales bacterium]|nr:NAD-dependent protein deacylase [Polyangiales bacterium]